MIHNSSLVRRAALALFGIAIVFAHGTSRAHAEQRVILHSGTELVGEVTMTDQNVVVDVAGAKIQIAFREIASLSEAKSPYVEPVQKPIASNGAASATPIDQARNLVLQAFETELMKMSNRTDFPKSILLEQAYELNPNDPLIAFWHATALSNSGSGKIAAEVLEAHRKELSLAYPEQFEHLESRIKSRLIIEQLPWQLVNRIDEFTSGRVPRSSNRTDRVPTMGIFRIQDQTGDSLRQSSFRVRASGNDEKLEAFDDGYFLFTYERYQNSNNEGAKIEVNQTVYHSNELALDTFTTDQTPVVNELTVRKLEKSDLVTFRVAVTGADNKPLEGAKVSLQPTVSMGNSREIPNADSGESGEVELKCPPGKYYLYINARGHIRHRETITLSDNDESIQRAIKLRQALQGSLVVSWQSSDGGGSSNVTSGTATLRLGAGGSRQDQVSNWIRFYQNDDQACLSIHNHPYGNNRSASGSLPWIRKAERLDATNSQDVEKDGTPPGIELKNLDLSKLSALRDQLVEPEYLSSNTSNHQHLLVVPVEGGEIFVGETMGIRNPTNGRFLPVTFKVEVKAVSKP